MKGPKAFTWGQRHADMWSTRPNCSHTGSREGQRQAVLAESGNSKPHTTAARVDPILRLVWGSLRPKWTLLSCKKLLTQGKRPALESDRSYPKLLSALQSLWSSGKTQPISSSNEWGP